MRGECPPDAAARRAPCAVAWLTATLPALPVLCRVPALPVLCADWAATVPARRPPVADEAVLVEPCIEDGYPRNLTVLTGENATFDCLGSWDWEMDLFWVFSENQTVNVRDLVDMDRLNRRAINQHQVSVGGRSGLPDPTDRARPPDLTRPCPQRRLSRTPSSRARRVTRRWWRAAAPTLSAR